MKEDFKQIERAVQLRNGYCATAIGILVTVVGGGITLVTWYFAGPGGGYIITWGALAVGGYYTIRGASLIASNASSKKITSTVALASTVILVVFLGGSLLALLDSFGVLWQSRQMIRKSFGCPTRKKYWQMVRLNLVAQ